MFGNDRSRRARPLILQHPVTFGLLVANISIFVLQYYIAPALIPRFSFIDQFALSWEGLRSGHFWQFLTYQFIHGNELHIICNCWAIYIFGQPVESFLGKQRTLILYLAGGVAGGVLQMAAAWFRPDYFDGPVIGASAGACALMAAFAALYPTQRLIVFVFFIFPTSMRARTMLGIITALTVAGLFWPFLKELPLLNRPLTAWDGWYSRHIIDGAVAHAGHLGGLLTGFAVSRGLLRRYHAPLPHAVGGG